MHETLTFLNYKLYLTRSYWLADKRHDQWTSLVNAKWIFLHMRNSYYVALNIIFQMSNFLHTCFSNPVLIWVFALFVIIALLKTFCHSLSCFHSVRNFIVIQWPSAVVSQIKRKVIKTFQFNWKQKCFKRFHFYSWYNLNWQSNKLVSKVNVDYNVIKMKIRVKIIFIEKQLSLELNFLCF